MYRRLTIVFVALALVAGACKGGEEKSLKTERSDDTTTSTSLTEGETTTNEGATVGATATTKKGTSTTTPPQGARPQTSGGSSSGGSSSSNDAPGPAAPGTYDYAQTGTTSQGDPPPRGKLIVSGTGPSQIFQRDLGDGSGGDLYFNFTSTGPYITKIVLRQGGAAINCAFDAPVPAPPWPPTTGKTFSGHATCGGGFTADFAGKITGKSSDKVDNKPVDTIVMESTLHATGLVLGQRIDVTVKDTQHWAPTLRVPTYSREVISGSFSGDVTSILLNNTPH